MNLWVDDERPAPDGWQHVKTVEDALHDLICFAIANLSLDNDLGVCDLRAEGREIVRQLVRMQEEDGMSFWPMQTLRIHSANPVARDAMHEMIKRYGPFRYDPQGHIFVRTSS